MTLQVAGGIAAGRTRHVRLVRQIVDHHASVVGHLRVADRDLQIAAPQVPDDVAAGRTRHDLLVHQIVDHRASGVGHLRVADRDLQIAAPQVPDDVAAGRTRHVRLVRQIVDRRASGVGHLRVGDRDLQIVALQVPDDVAAGRTRHDLLVHQIVDHRASGVGHLRVADRGLRIVALQVPGDVVAVRNYLVFPAGHPLVVVDRLVLVCVLQSGLHQIRLPVHLVLVFDLVQRIVVHPVDRSLQSPDLDREDPAAPAPSCFVAVADNHRHRGFEKRTDDDRERIALRQALPGDRNLRVHIPSDRDIHPGRRIQSGDPVPTVDCDRRRRGSNHLWNLAIRQTWQHVGTPVLKAERDCE